MGWEREDWDAAVDGFFDVEVFVDDDVVVLLSLLVLVVLCD